MFRKIVAAPISWVYGMVVNFRHKLFDWKILPTEEFDIPIVCVGNLTVGGTGKTPHTEYLVRHFSKTHNVAVLSRGYGRRTRGFVLATTESSYLKIGDEPKQIKLKFPNIPVAVCEKRVVGIKELRRLHPEVNLIILDDAFQHRYVESWVNVLLVDYNRPIYRDKFLPLGNLRDAVRQKDRAQLIVMTKCPPTLKPLDMRVARNEMQLYPYQTLLFSRFRQGELTPIFPEQQRVTPTNGQNIVGLAGIANPKNFFGDLFLRYNLLDTISFPDHHSYKVKDLNRIISVLKLQPPDTIVVMTEKDAVKLTNRKKIPVSLQQRLYYLPIEVEFIEDSEVEFARKIDSYVEKNHKHSILHPE